MNIPTYEELKRALKEIDSRLIDSYNKQFPEYHRMLEVSKWSIERDLKRLEVLDDDCK